MLLASNSASWFPLDSKRTQPRPRYAPPRWSFRLPHLLSLEVVFGHTRRPPPRTHRLKQDRMIILSTLRAAESWPISRPRIQGRQSVYERDILIVQKRNVQLDLSATIELVVGIQHGTHGSWR